MNNLYGIYCILSIDHNKKENLIISTNDDTIAFPIFKIEHPRLLYNELRYNLQNILLKQAYNAEAIRKISFCHIELQNEIVLKYIESNYSEKYDLDKDMFVLCATIIEEPYNLNLFQWKKFKFAKSLLDMDLVTSIIDFTIEKSIL